MNRKTWTIKELLEVTNDYLKKKEIENSRLNAEVLLAHQLDLDRVRLYLHFDQPLSDKEIAGYRSLVRRRLDREPLQYITGTQEFWSLEFHVGPQVLIPRPESELLIEVVVGLGKDQRFPETSSPRILDLGTGCGALAISLACEFKEAFLFASDLSEDALNTARLNAERHGVGERIEFRPGDLFQPFAEHECMFDIILSNPPYIPSEEFGTLPAEVQNHEPRMALDGGEGGMFFIEKIIMEAAGYLIPGGWVLLEMAPDQTEKALGLLDGNKNYGKLERVRDYSNQYRVVMAQKKYRILTAS